MFSCSVTFFLLLTTMGAFSYLLTLEGTASGAGLDWTRALNSDLGSLTLAGL
jgi:hypothetical protein